MKNIIMAFYEFCANHKIATTIVCILWFVMTVILNSAYWGKPVPVTGMILQPWMAITNCVLVGAVTGNVTTVALLS